MRNASFLPSQEIARAISNRERTLAASKLAAAFPPASLLAGIWNERTHPL